MIKPVHATCENEGADQSAHSRSLISAFVFRCLDSITPTLASAKIPRIYLASLAEQADLRLTWSEIPEDRFSRDMAQMVK